MSSPLRRSAYGHEPIIDKTRRLQVNFVRARSRSVAACVGGPDRRITALSIDNDIAIILYLQVGTWVSWGSACPIRRGATLPIDDEITVTLHQDIVSGVGLGPTCP